MDLYPQDISQEQFDRIDSYLSGSMDSDTLAEFKAELKSNPTLKAQVEAHKAMIKAVDNASMKRLLNDMHDEVVHEGENPIDTLKKNRKPRTYLIAASVTILVALGGFWFYSNQGGSNNLFEKFFQPDPGLAVVMSGNNNFEFNEAMVAYKRGNYNEAINSWKDLLDEKPKSDTLNYFLGVAHLALGDENLAIEYLNTASKTPMSTFYHDINHNLGMAHLKKRELEKAREYFSQSDLEESKIVLSKLNK